MKAYKKQYINGEWRTGSTEAELENRNPYTGDLIYSYRAAGKSDVDDAYRAAAAAQTEWGKLPPAALQAYLTKLKNAMEEMKDEFYSVMIEESGSVHSKVDFEFSSSVGAITSAMPFPYMMQGTILPSNIPGKENYIYRIPKGVIGVIAPWNMPISLAMRAIAPAVATGNTVVLKPSSETPGSAFLIAEIFERAGFPKGVMNAVAGRGSDIGDEFVKHPIPAMISFTGSSEIGKRVGMLATNGLKDVALELGGNNVMIVLKDADLEAAAKAAVYGCYCHNGQICMAINRIVVDETVHDRFVSLLIDATKKLKTGDPANKETNIGPIINPAQVCSIERLIQQTIQAGAKVSLEGNTQGNVIAPWIFTNVTNSMPAAATEVFGPVCCVLKFKSEQEAVGLANDSAYGLCGSVYTGDIYHGMQIARMVKAGMVHVNDQTIVGEPHVMFGGEKESGIGRFKGKWAVEACTTEQLVTVQQTPRAY